MINKWVGLGFEDLTGQPALLRAEKAQPCQLRPNHMHVPRPKGLQEGYHLALNLEESMNCSL